MSKSRGRGADDHVVKDVRNKQDRRNQRKLAAKRKHQALEPSPRRGG